MTNRLQQLFAEKNKNILAVYFTAGFPTRDDTRNLLQALETAGADLVEIGIPFSDPLADGPVIQACGQTALENGMTLELLFEQLADMRPAVKLPVLLMGYINPVMQFGIARFCKACKETGVDGVILPDLPLAEFETQYKPVFDAQDITVILLVTPQTTDERIRKIDALSNGFIYAVSSSSTTGNTSGFGKQQVNYFQRLETMQLKNRVLVGFGVHDRETFAAASAHVAGGIVGTAFLRHLAANGTGTTGIAQFIKKIKQEDHDYSTAT